MVPPIVDYNTYTSGMAKSIEDKLFWVNMIPKSEYDIVIDYGCADGQFLREVRKRNPKCFVCGIDIDDLMLNKARHTIGLQNASYINANNEKLPCNKEVINGVLNLSSVIHEIYSYKTEKEINQFWKYVFESGYKYICIRDMAITEEVAHDKKRINYILNMNNTDEVLRREKFQSVFGSIYQKKNFVHYMMKYRYTENWEREVNENYLPITVEELEKIIPDEYEIVFKKHFVLPFLKDKIAEDWNINFDIPTHIKLILRKK